jgi:hypothetical protein
VKVASLRASALPFAWHWVAAVQDEVATAVPWHSAAVTPSKCAVIWRQKDGVTAAEAIEAS